MVQQKEGIEMYMSASHPNPYHAILNLEGGDEEVLHLQAFGKDLDIEIRIDDAKTGIVIKTRDGRYRQALEAAEGRPFVPTSRQAI